MTLQVIFFPYSFHSRWWFSIIKDLLLLLSQSPHSYVMVNKLSRACEDCEMGEGIVWLPNLNMFYVINLMLWNLHSLDFSHYILAEVTPVRVQHVFSFMFFSKSTLFRSANRLMTYNFLLLLVGKDFEWICTCICVCVLVTSGWNAEWFEVRSRRLNKFISPNEYELTFLWLFYSLGYKMPPQAPRNTKMQRSFLWLSSILPPRLVKIGCPQGRY